MAGVSSVNSHVFVGVFFLTVFFLTDFLNISEVYFSGRAVLRLWAVDVGSFVV